MVRSVLVATKVINTPPPPIDISDTESASETEMRIFREKVNIISLLLP